MKIYKEYKDSGVMCPQNIPSHWHIQKIKFSFHVEAGATPKSSNDDYWDGGIKWITPADFGDTMFVDGGARNISQEGLESCSTYLAPKGSIVFSKRAPIGLTAITTDELCTNQGCLLCIPDNKESNVLYNYYAISCMKEQFEILGAGATFKEISANNFINTKLPCPPLSEQQSIASFLDAKTKPIDDIISKREKQIELLQEMKSAIISRAVTKGLNPNTKMKDSGIEWIGDIPEEWSMIKTSLLFRLIGSGTTPPKNGTNYADEGLCWLQTGDLNDGYISDTSKYITESAIQENSALTLFSKGSLVIAMYGATIGKIGILDIDCYTNQACCVLGKGKKINIKYAFYTYQACKSALINESRGGGQPNISQDIIRHFKIPVPPLEEQDYISSYLDTETSKLDSRIAKRRKQIELLHEYKQALITNAVTGKIDVRGFNS